uniref:Ig-like domain-containing protein n=1 Tax=Elaeophora elaphi TaxID=1147741 RepID=A0A0R3S2B0_9BILA
MQVRFLIILEHLTDAPYLHFTKTPKEVEIATGDDFMLQCEAAGIPPPVIEWFLLLHLLIKSLYGVTASKIAVPCDKSKNAAEYKCLANNGYQKLESTTTVVAENNVKCAHNHSPPIINMWTDGRFERSGATVQLFCRVHGAPNISKIELIFQILSNGDLIIYDTQWEDMGVYTCIASNEYGRDQITTFFYPTEP